MNQHDLDKQLEATAWVGDLMRSVAADEPSLQWRSSLNERILAAKVQQAQKRKRLTWIFGSTTGLACAASLAAVLFLHPVSNTPATILIPSDNLEAQIVTAFREDAAVGDEVAASAKSVRESNSDLTSGGAADYEVDDSIEI